MICLFNNKYLIMNNETIGEEELYKQTRLIDLNNKLKKGINPYPHKFQITISFPKRA